MYPKFAGWGLDLQSELNTVQFVIPAGAGATFTAANNVGTITFNAAHGLTMVPAAGKMPNYFIGFGGSTSGLAGTGILVGNVFSKLRSPGRGPFDPRPFRPSLAQSLQRSAPARNGPKPRPLSAKPRG